MRPFAIDVPQSSLDDLRRRLRETRWPDELPGVGWSRGVPLPYLRDLAGYWAEKFDWRAVERRLNAFPQFVDEIDGATVHFLHVRSADPDATPLLITHGWPGAVSEFAGIIDALTDPAAHGGAGAPAFHVVIPSIPGYGFSTPLRETGWDVPRITGAWAELMTRLGYERFIAQGGDAGSVVSLHLARTHPERVIGAHVNMLMTFPSGDPAETAELTAEDGARLAKLARFDAELSAYMKLQATRPQTLAYALNDSPAGLLAWIVERFHDWTDAVESPEEVVHRDDILTLVSIYWFTQSAGSSAQFYYEGAEGVRQAASGAVPPPTPVPVSVLVFPHDIFVPVRRLAERDTPSITRWVEAEAGGHFAALEQPQALVDDLRAFAGSLT